MKRDTLIKVALSNDTIQSYFKKRKKKLISDTKSTDPAVKLKSGKVLYNIFRDTDIRTRKSSGYFNPDVIKNWLPITNNK